VSGDSADDGHWCGLAITDELFPPMIQLKINNEAVRNVRTLFAGLLQAGDGPIISLSLEGGVVSASDFLNSEVLLKLLVSLEIKAGILAGLEQLFLSGHSKLRTSIMHGDLEVKASALQEMEALRILRMKDVKSVPRSALKGYTALEKMDLDSVTVVQADTFAWLISLTHVDVTSACFLYAKSFSGCIALTQLSLPRVFELVSDSHFSNCVHLSSVSLLHLPFVEPEASNIFAGCSSLSSLALWRSPLD
jgi:hypothetical protein